MSEQPGVESVCELSSDSGRCVVDQTCRLWQSVRGTNLWDFAQHWHHVDGQRSDRHAEMVGDQGCARSYEL